MEEFDRMARQTRRLSVWRSVHVPWRPARVVAAALLLGVAASLLSAAPASAQGTYGPSNPSYAAYYANPSSQATWAAFCAGAGDGATYTGVQALGVPACGPTPTATETDILLGPTGSGGPTQDFQCVEFAERYLWVKDGYAPIDGTNGDQVVGHYATAHGLPIVLNGSGQLPQVGAVMSFASTSAFDDQSGGHVAVVTAVTASSVTIAGENQNGSGPYTDGYATMSVSGNDYVSSFSADKQIEWVNPPGGAVTNGEFVTYGGNAYRIVGGAPVYVSSWSAFGGVQPTDALSESQWAALPQFPADGTFIRGAQSGAIYVIAGGAPVYVSTLTPFGSPQITNVDQVAIDDAGSSAPFNHDSGLRSISHNPPSWQRS